MKIILQAIKILSVITITSLVTSSVYAFVQEDCILGPGDGTAFGGPETDDVGLGTGSNDEKTWKAFRWRAGRAGEAYYFSILMLDIVGGYKEADATYGVWEDDAGSMGDLKVWGYEEGHVFHEYTREYLYMQSVAPGKNRTITYGHYYWIGWRSFLSNTDNHFRRASNTDYCCDVQCCTKVQYETDEPHPVTDTPVHGSNFATGYGDNYYGWAIWPLDGRAAGVLKPTDQSSRFFVQIIPSFLI